MKKNCPRIITMSTMSPNSLLQLREHKMMVLFILNIVEPTVIHFNRSTGDDKFSRLRNCAIWPAHFTVDNKDKDLLDCD
jgi:hypothetical protein